MTPASPSPPPRHTARAAWRQLVRGVRALTRGAERERDVADEVAHYHELSVAAGMADGMSRADARRAARLAIGSETAMREQLRGYGWENVVESTLADVRFAMRRLLAEPGFTVVALLTIALGVGGTTAVFSAVKPVLFESLPYPDAGRITAIWEERQDGGRGDGSFGMYQALAARTRTFEALAVAKSWQPTIAGADHPERLEGQRVSWRYLDVLGVRPAIGRSFAAEEDRAGGGDVVVISDALWRRRFGADAGIIGRTVSLDERAYVVIGVMPAHFENVLAPTAQLWAPLQYDLAQGRAWGHHLRTIGRLLPSASVEGAGRELDALGNTVLAEMRPETYGDVIRFTVLSLQDDVLRGARPARLAILGAMSLVLVITCVNVTNLLVARGVRRRGEFALRAALGAGGSRLMRQLLTESLLLAALGGVAGIGVAMAAIRAIALLTPAELPRASAIGFDGVAFAFTAGLTALIGLAFGALPARQAAKSDPHRELRLGARQTSDGAHRRMRGALVVAEVAIALVLLVGSGLLLRSLQHLFAVEPGFDATRRLTMQIQTTGARFEDDEVTRRYFAEVLRGVQRVPGVASAALTSQLPLSGEADRYGVAFERGAPPRDGEDPSAFRYAVSPGYLATMGIALRAGRAIDERDRAGAPRVALISESYARRVFPAADPLGERLRIGPVQEPITIVGVVADVKQLSLAVSPADAVYLPAAQWPTADRVMSLVVRSADGATAVAAAVRDAIWAVDRNQPVVRMATMEELLTSSAAERRFALILFEAFALAALALAAAGIYGMISGGVAERTPEIGVRSALGATRGDILALVFRDGARLAGLGVVLGLAGAAAASRTISAMLFGISPLDPLTYAGVAALLMGVALFACAVPAWRAARLDPSATLRVE